MEGTNLENYIVVNYPDPDPDPTNAKFKCLNFRKQINLVVLLFIQKQFSSTISMYEHLTECKTRTESMHISFCFYKNCICLIILENIQISVNMIDILDITDDYSVKCDFILNTVIFINAALNISLRKN